MNYYLAIDQGTHASRAILYDDNGTLITTETQAIDLYRLSKGHIEQDAEQILTSIKTVLARLFKNLTKEIRHNIVSCGIACQRTTALICDTSGKALSPAISWQDTRGTSLLEDLPLSAESIQRISGLPLSAHYSVSKLLCLQKNHVTQQNSDDQDIYFAPLISYLLMHLSETGMFVVDHTQAQRTQLFDIEKLKWSETLLETFQISQHKLPIVKPVQHDYGYLKNTHIPIKAVCGDQNAALIGTNYHERDSALVNLGSGAFILRKLHTFSSSTRLLTGIANSSTNTKHYCREATVNGSGNALGWFRKLLQKHRSKLGNLDFLDNDKLWHQQMTVWLEQTKNQQTGIIFINSVGGIGSPWWTSKIEPHFYYDASISVKKLTRDNLAEHALAVIESIAFLLQDNLAIMQKEERLIRLKISGGLSQINELCQKLSNLSQLPIQRITDKETTAKGVAWLASGKQSIWATNTDKRYQPTQDASLESRYHLFRSRLKTLCNNDKNTQKALWIGHRGDMTHYPENTLIALRFALKNGATAIEFDVQMNASDDFVVIHDADFKRTANKNLSSLKTTTEAIRKISAHEPQKYSTEFYPETVPLLEQVLTLLDEFPSAQAFLEIKEESLRYWGTKKVMDTLFSKLENYQDRLIIISFDDNAISYAQNHSNFRHGWVVKKYNQEHQLKAQQLQPNFLICNYKKIDDFHKLWSGTWQWMLYDIKDKTIEKQLLAQGIQWLETGDIAAMLSIPEGQNNEKHRH